MLTCDNPYCDVDIDSFYIGNFYDGIRFEFCSADCWIEFDRM